MRPIPTRFALALASLASGAIAAACASYAPEPVLPASELTGTSWVAQAIDGAAIAGPAPRIDFDRADRLRGTGGCNQLSGIYEVGAGAIDVRALAVTERACDQSIMRQEGAFVSLLDAADRYRRDGDQLVLTAEDGRRAVLAQVSG